MAKNLAATEVQTLYNAYQRTLQNAHEGLLEAYSDMPKALELLEKEDTGMKLEAFEDSLIENTEEEFKELLRIIWPTLDIKDQTEFSRFEP